VNVIIILFRNIISWAIEKKRKTKTLSETKTEEIRPKLVVIMDVSDLPSSVNAG